LESVFGVKDDGEPGNTNKQMRGGELRDVYYQQTKKQGVLEYDGQTLVPGEYREEDGETGRGVVYEYLTYDEAFSMREVIFYVPMALLRRP
jgi:hypothetical protein